MVVDVDQGAQAAVPAAPEPRDPRTTPRTTSRDREAPARRTPPPVPVRDGTGAFGEPQVDAAASDAELLTAHLRGTDPGAFTELTRRHRTRLWAVAGAILSNPQDAEDAVQDAMLRAFVHAGTFRGESSVYVWLRALTVNVSTTLAAKRARLASRTTSQDPGYKPDRSAYEATSAIDLDELLRHALLQVPEEQRTAFVLVQLLDVPAAEVAHLQNVRVKTIYTRIHRARLRLVELLDYKQVIELLRRIDG